MGASFVQIEEKGFWMRDGLLELWLRLLALHLEDPRDHGSRVRQIRDGWLLASRGYFGGWVPVNLGEAVRDEEGRRAVVGAIHSLVSALKKGPPILDRGTLNILGIDAAYCADHETDRLLEVAQAFLDLIDGKIHTTAADTSFMPGSRTPA